MFSLFTPVLIPDNPPDILDFKRTMVPTPICPYIPLNTTAQPCSLPNNATIAHASTPTPTILISSEAGTSLATPDIVGIIAAVLFLFGGLAWFAYHALITLPKRRRTLLRKRRGRRNEGRGRSRVV
jgi:hypothetical protein